MRPILESGSTTEQSFLHSHCHASEGIHVLTCEEVEQVSGGIAPVIIAALQWGGAIAGGVVITRVVNDAYDWLFGEEEEMSCSM